MPQTTNAKAGHAWGARHQAFDSEASCPLCSVALSSGSGDSRKYGPRAGCTRGLEGPRKGSCTDPRPSCLTPTTGLRGPTDMCQYPERTVARLLAAHDLQPGYGSADASRSGPLRAGGQGAIQYNACRIGDTERVDVRGARSRKPRRHRKAWEHYCGGAIHARG